MERGCLPANSVVDVDELPPLPHAQGPTNYLRDPLSTWERLTLSNTFCESRALSVPRQNKEDLNTYCLNMAVCRRKMKKGRQWTADRRRSPFSKLLRCRRNHSGFFRCLGDLNAVKCSQGLVYGLNGCDVLLFRRGAAAEVRLHVFVLQHFAAESGSVYQ